MAASISTNALSFPNNLGSNTFVGADPCVRPILKPSLLKTSLCPEDRRTLCYNL